MIKVSVDYSRGRRKFEIIGAEFPIRYLTQENKGNLLLSFSSFPGGKILGLKGLSLKFYLLLPWKIQLEKIVVLLDGIAGSFSCL